MRLRWLESRQSEVEVFIDDELIGKVSAFWLELKMRLTLAAQTGLLRNSITVSGISRSTITFLRANDRALRVRAIDQEKTSHSDFDWIKTIKHRTAIAFVISRPCPLDDLQHRMIGEDFSGDSR